MFQIINSHLYIPFDLIKAEQYLYNHVQSFKKVSALQGLSWLFFRGGFELREGLSFAERNSKSRVRATWKKFQRGLNPQTPPLATSLVY